jgi:retron-type reverse transcriptase
VSTNLTWIGEKARPQLVFTSLYHHVNDVDNLRECFKALKADKAAGVDGVTKQQYEERLEENLAELSERLQRMGYRPQPKRRTYVPKAGSAKGRPIGISSLEDKLVELSVKRVLEPIYEVVFEDSSFGYPSSRSGWVILWRQTSKGFSITSTTVGCSNF